MKLATLRDGSRDGQLAVVSRDLTQAHFAAGIATTLQQALDDWNFIAPQLQDLATTLDHGKARHAFPFDTQAALAPLPRAGHCALQALGAPPPAFWPADLLWGPGEAMRLPPAAAGGDAAGRAWLAPGLMAVCGDIERGTPADAAPEGVRLLMACAALLWLPPGAASAQPLALACSAVALTPDELGPAWPQGGLLLQADAGRGDPPWPVPGAAALGAVIAALAQWRPLRAGALAGWRLPLPHEATAAGVPHALALTTPAPASPRTVLTEAGGGAGPGPFGTLSLRLLPATSQG